MSPPSPDWARINCGHNATTWHTCGSLGRFTVLVVRSRRPVQGLCHAAARTRPRGGEHLRWDASERGVALVGLRIARRSEQGRKQREEESRSREFPCTFSAVNHFLLTLWASFPPINGCRKAMLSCGPALTSQPLLSVLTYRPYVGRARVELEGGGLTVGAL